ncbi:MAG: carboxymuconolactone decarboxylase family protein [Myxococcota bacterium]
MADLPKPPSTYKAFVSRFPELGEAWQSIREGEGKGPLDEKASRLVKLGVAVGAMREGAVHSAVRKAKAAGATREEIEHVVTLAASTIGLPSSVAVWSWMTDVPE